MKKILCLTDFSDNAQSGLLYANELAKLFSSKLIMMHVFEYPSEKPVHPSYTRYTDTEARDMLYRTCMNFRKENRYTNVTYEYIVREGNLIDNVNNVITECNIDIVICSLTGELKPGDDYFGNIISEIIQHTQCPLIIVPTGYKFNNIKNIVYAYDIEKGTDLKQQAINFARLFDSRVDVLSFVNTEDEEETDHLYSKYSKLKLKSGYNKMDFDLRVAPDVSSSISRFVVDRNADLIILENHKRVLVEQQTTPSFTKGFVFIAKTPVLVIHNQEN